MVTLGENLDVRRRQFIALLGSAAVVPPLVANAQQRERMRRVGVILPAPADDAEFQAWVGAFLQGLAQSGWIIGRNVRIETRWAGDKADDIRKHAAELVAIAPDVILAQGARRGLRSLVPRRLPVRRRSLQPCSPRKPKNGARWCVSPAPSRIDICD